MAKRERGYKYWCLGAVELTGSAPSALARRGRPVPAVSKGADQAACVTMVRPSRASGRAGAARAPLHQAVREHQVNSMITASTAMLSPGLALMAFTTPSR